MSSGIPKPKACHGLNKQSRLAERLSVQWSGPLSTLLFGLAARWGWSFENHLGKAHDPNVAI